MKNVLRIAWASAILALISMIAGHMGEHDLSWISNQISTFAAKAPYDYLVTASMYMSAVTLLCLSLLASKYQLFGNNSAVHLVPLVSGAAISGLVLLASFEEACSSIYSASPQAVRQQSIHDAGLLTFFFHSEFLLVLMGWLCLISAARPVGKMIGVAVLFMSLLSLILLGTDWPRLLGVQGAGYGLNQRALFFCVWLAIILVLSFDWFDRKNQGS